MVSFEILIKSMPPSLSELKVIPSFCFAFKIPDDTIISIKKCLYFFDLTTRAEIVKFFVAILVQTIGHQEDILKLSDL